MYVCMAHIDSIFFNLNQPYLKIYVYIYILPLRKCFTTCTTSVIYKSFTILKAHVYVNMNNLTNIHVF